jgi:Domain of unknown function (DUF4190)
VSSTTPEPDGSDQPVPPPYGAPGYGTPPSPPPPSGPPPSGPPAYGPPPQAPAYGSPPGNPYATPQPGAVPPPPFGQPATQPMQPYGYVGQGFPDNKLGVWALVLGILSVACCGLLSGIPAIIIGVQARQRTAAGTANNGGMGTAGIVLGAIGTALSVIGLIVYAFVFAAAVRSGSFSTTTTP